MFASYPDRGNFTEGNIHVNEKLKSYVCTHNTSPPGNQNITVDNINPLIRALKRRQLEIQTLKRQRSNTMNAADEQSAKKQKTRTFMFLLYYPALTHLLQNTSNTHLSKGMKQSWFSE